MLRSLIKTGTFATVHFSVAFTISYLLTGSIAIASAIALIEPMANTVAYYFHERAWERLGARANAERLGHVDLATEPVRPSGR